MRVLHLLIEDIVEISHLDACHAIVSLAQQRGRGIPGVAHMLAHVMRCSSLTTAYNRVCTACPETSMLHLLAPKYIHWVGPICGSSMVYMSVWCMPNMPNLYACRRAFKPFNHSSRHASLYVQRGFVGGAQLMLVFVTSGLRLAIF
jgi:hypothetical protein